MVQVLVPWCTRCLLCCYALRTVWCLLWCGLVYCLLMVLIVGAYCGVACPVVCRCVAAERGFARWRQHPERITGFYPRMLEGDPPAYQCAVVGALIQHTAPESPLDGHQHSAHCTRPLGMSICTLGGRTSIVHGQG